MNEDTVTVDEDYSTDSNTDSYPTVDDGGFIGRKNLFQSIHKEMFIEQIIDGPAEEVAQYAIDATIDAVVAWLRITGHSAKATILFETYGD